jgi:hypothetical protein
MKQRVTFSSQGQGLQISSLIYFLSEDYCPPVALLYHHHYHHLNLSNLNSNIDLFLHFCQNLEHPHLMPEIGQLYSVHDEIIIFLKKERNSKDLRQLCKLHTGK